MKSNWIVTAAAIAFAFPISAYADDLGKWIGTYSTAQQNFVTVKRLTFTRQKDGSTKIHGVLVGFPDEVSIGETAAEPYAQRGSKDNTDAIVAMFPSERFKPLMVITPIQWDGTHWRIIGFNCYMKDADGSRVHISGNLEREPDSK